MTPEEKKKETKRLYDIEYRKKNKDKYNKLKKDKIANMSLEERQEMYRKKYALLDKTKKKKEDKEYAKKNKEKLNDIKKKWAENNPEKKKESNRKYHIKKLENPLYKLKHYTSNTIRRALKNNGYSKKSRTYEILGCSYIEFKNYIESQFADWMNWDNYGNPKDGLLKPNKTWDIDHKIPLSSAKTEEDIIRLNHYSNLQPLCSYNNRFIKKDTI